MPIPENHEVVDVNIDVEIPLFSPAYLQSELPLEPAGADFIKGSRDKTGEILAGTSDRLLVIVGPCSIHDIESARAYGELIAEARERYRDDLEIIMRAYFEKPRTTTGWEGFIADPNLDGSYQMNHGLFQARKLLLHLASRGVPTATEFVSVTNPQFIADLVTYAAIGARTVESQPHRKLGSGLSMPVGFKNATSGKVQPAVDAVISARHQHWFDSITKHGTHALFRSKSNDRSHIILRGGAEGANFDEQSVKEAANILKKAGLPETVVIDASHGNSNKDYKNQPGVVENIAGQIHNGSRNITGVMIEGHHKEGAQKIGPNADPDISVTDSCVSWGTTIDMLEVLARAVRARRTK